MQVYHSVAEPSLRLPSALSITVLYTTHKFALGALEIASSVGKSSGVPPNRVSYDVVVFEAAAYAHGWLMKESLGKTLGNLDDESYQRDNRNISYPDHNHDDKEQAYFRVLKDSVHVTNGLIRSDTNFEVHEDFFLNRVKSYASSTADVAAQFERILVPSIVKGSPSIRGRDAQFGGLPLELAVKTYVPVFQQTLADLTQTAKDLYDASEKGLL